jgi:tetratricopeptide (TPR) repeat protein
MEPVAPSPAKARLIAELAFRRGKSAFRSGILGKALTDLKRAAELDPEAVEYQLYATWVEHQTSKGWKTLAALRQKLAERVQAALAEDRNLAFAHHVQAHLYLLREEQDKALRAFRIAYKLDASDVDAERHIRLLVSRK